MLIFVIAGALAATAWGGLRWTHAIREAAAVEAWARHLDYEEARVAFEKGRDTMVDHLVNPRLSLIRTDRERRKVTARAVAARSRMNEITGQPHGPGFRLGYRAEFVQECKRFADAVHDELDRKLAEFGPLVPPQAGSRSETRGARRPARARPQ